MPEFSGVAAVLPQAGLPHEPPAGEQLMGFMERMINIKNAQKVQATQSLQAAIAMAQQGFPIDPKAFDKLVKKSGLPLPTKLEDQVAGLAGQKATNGQPSPGQPAVQPASVGAQPGGQPSTATAQVGQAQQGQDQQPKPKSMGEIVQQMGQRAAALANKTAANAAEVADNEAKVNALVKQVAAGGEEGDKAYGTLVRMNKFRFDVNAENWFKATPEQRSKMINIAAGAATDAQIKEWGIKLGDSLISSGKFADPGDAYTAGKQLAETGSISPEVKAKMRPNSIAELADQAKLGDSLIQMGVPLNKLGSTMRKAEAGGLLNALPPNLKPIALEGLKLEKEKVGIEATVAGADWKRAEAAMIKAEAEATTKDKKDSLDNFKALVDIKKAGGNVPSDLMKAAQADLGNKFNMDVTLVKTFWDRVTFSDPSGIQMTPRLTESGKDTVHKFAGGDNAKPDKPSILQRFLAGPKEPI
jgi:hypothetical protein